MRFGPPSMMPPRCIAWLGKIDTSSSHDEQIRPSVSAPSFKWPGCSERGTLDAVARVARGGALMRVASLVRPFVVAVLSAGCGVGTGTFVECAPADAASGSDAGA